MASRTFTRVRGLSTMVSFPISVNTDDEYWEWGNADLQANGKNFPFSLIDATTGEYGATYKAGPFTDLFSGQVTATAIFSTQNWRSVTFGVTERAYRHLNWTLYRGTETSFSTGDIISAGTTTFPTGGGGATVTVKSSVPLGANDWLWLNAKPSVTFGVDVPYDTVAKRVFVDAEQGKSIVISEIAAFAEYNNISEFTLNLEGIGKGNPNVVEFGTARIDLANRIRPDGIDVSPDFGDVDIAYNLDGIDSSFDFGDTPLVSTSADKRVRPSNSMPDGVEVGFPTVTKVTAEDFVKIVLRM